MLERVQWVHEPTDLWDITFCIRRFWPIKFQKIFLCSAAELIRHETQHTYLRDRKYFLPIANNFEFFWKIQICSKSYNCVKINSVWLENLKVTTFLQICIDLTVQAWFETCFPLKMTKKSLKLLTNEATLCPSKSFMIACFFLL